MKILIHKPNDDSGLRLTKKHLESIKNALPKARVTAVKDINILNKLIPQAEVLIPASVSEIENIDFSKAKNLKWIHVTSAGVNALPKELIELNIIITNSSGVHPIPISEHVLAFMLIFARQIHKSYRIQLNKKGWIRDPKIYDVLELSGKTVGIIGLGRIGKRIAKLAKAFEMKVLAVRKGTEKYEYTDEVYQIKNIDKVLKDADFIVNALPSTKETYHFFDYKKITKMKKSAYFINIGRGTTVVENDLIKALKNNKIKGAGLDVFEEEPLSSKSPLWEMENVIITPHSSGMTPYYIDRVIDIFCQNLKAYLKNLPMPNLVDLKKGY